MSYNSFGHLFKVTSWGESHGVAIGCIVDGCPPKIQLSDDEFAYYMSRRRPGQSSYVSQRSEKDIVKILSGVISDGKGRYITTGAPISLLIENTDTQSKDYSSIRDLYRPSHGDYSYAVKYGIRDPLGGGRASARETATRVAAGVIARKILPDVKINGCVSTIGKYTVSESDLDWDAVNSNPFYFPNSNIVSEVADYIRELSKEGSSIGGIVTLVAENVPKGLGAPIYAKLDQDIAGLIMSINAVKAVEIGDGFAVAQMRGEENADMMAVDCNNNPYMLSNHAGGILAGISTGEPIKVRFAVKPTSSIGKRLQTIDKDNNPCYVSVKGRHDPCIAIRAVAVGEAVLACVLADHYLLNRGQIGC